MINVLFLLNKKEGIFHLHDGKSNECFHYMNMVSQFLDGLSTIACHRYMSVCIGTRDKTESNTDKLQR